MGFPLNKIKIFLLKEPIILLRLGLGTVFILAGLHRIIFFKMAYNNFIDVGIVPATPFVVFTIILELIVGFLLIINKFVKQSCIAIAMLLIVGITASILRAGHILVENINEVFLLTHTPTDIILHISYLIGVLTILLFSFGKKTNMHKI